MITLSRPPSVNHLYGLNIRGRFPIRYITEEGKAWFEEAHYKIKTQYKVTHTTPVGLYIKAYLWSRGDLDNLLKALQDALQKAGVIENDSLVHYLQIERIKVDKNDQKIEIEIKELTSK
jgi:crossover junction endodeoxyribonuclease RusA